MSSPLPQFIRPPTSSNQEGRSKDSSEDIFILSAIASLATSLQLKYQKANPFETDFVIMVAFVVALQIYCLALYGKKKVEDRIPDFAEIIHSYGRLCGFLSNVLLLLLLVPILGWIIFGIWVCYFIMVTYWSHDKITALFHQATNIIREKFNILMSRRKNSKPESNGSRNEEPNADDSAIMRQA